MRLLLNIFLLLSFAPLYSELYAQCSVTAAITSNYNGQDVSCNGACDGEIAATPSGGTTPYTYSWSGNQTTPIISGICAGIHSLTVTDAVGCTATTSVTVTDVPPLMVNVTNTTDVMCFGTCTGNATVSASGGVGQGYTYLWNAATGNQTTATATNLCAGIYSVTATDFNGCTSATSVIITELSSTALNTITTITHPSQTGATDGSISVTASGGTAPYTYIWPTGQVGPVAGGLSSGTYCVTVTDANGCSTINCTTLFDSPITLRGQVRLDSNNNCTPDINEPLIGSQIIKATNSNSGLVQYFSTNSNGLYEADLDTGSYTLEYFPINSLYGNSCVNQVNVTIPTLNSIDTVNWVLEAGTPCHLMVVSIGAPFLRIAGGGSWYNVHYCNNGTLDAYNSYVEVNIDSFLNVTSTSIAPTSVVGNTYQFDLDTVRVGECGNIYIYVTVDAAAIPGQTHCSYAHIYPDSFCLPLWNGPILKASNTCQNDSIFFKIKNTGNNMLAAEDYSIFEDDIIIQMAPFNLNGGDSVEVIQPADLGKTYRIQARQANGFPPQLGPSIVHSYTEGCRPFNNGSFNTGFLTQYYTGNTAYFIDNDCQSNITSFDPNDKAAQPEGYGSAHYIEANTPLKYRIRFQNTGTDTAFNIVIVDTLSTNVDASSLLMGASSHPYTWELSGTGVLTVRFDDILLVDSNANEPLSHGFFTYSINQVPNLINGSIINNQAAIYFDFNPPIFTNVTTHTIGENFIPIVLKMEEAWIEDMKVHIYPNPTSGLVYIDQLGENDIQIKVFDHLGRNLVQKNVSDQQTALDLNDLTSGVYYINIQQKENSSTHKIVIQH